MFGHIRIEYNKVELIMRKLIFTAVMCLLATIPMMAQQISGKIVDDKGDPLSFANVVLLNRQDSAFVQGTVSGDDGRFSIDASCNGGIIKVTCVGYKTVCKDCEGEDVGVIKMEVDTKMLSEVVVKSSLPKTILKNGGMTTIVAGSILEKAGTIEHLLDRIPNVSAQNGSIKVLGRGAPVIYINGREMRDQSELDRLHADDIKSVEVISNPGARYAASTKAVIRIVTKKIQGDGFGFEATAEGVCDEEKNFGGTGQLNTHYRRNGLELGVYVSGARQNSAENKDVEQITYLDKKWDQQEQIRRTWKTEAMNSRLSASYQLNDSNSLGASFSFIRSPKQNYDENNIGYLLQDDALSELSHSLTHYLTQNSTCSSNVYYVGKVGKLGIDFNTDWFWSKEYNDCNTDEKYQESGPKILSQFVNSITTKYNRLIASRLVLTHPLWGGELSVGGEYSFTNRNTDYAITPTSLADNDKNRIKEGMASAFLAYNHDFGKLSMEAGLRYENVNFKYYDDGKYVADQSKTYGNWFPSLSLSMPVGNVQMQVSYATDISRPNYWVLRSNIKYDDRYSYETGNPFLVSEIARNLTYDLSYKWLVFNFAYSRTSNPIYQTVEIYKDNAAIGLMKMINGKSYNSVSASLNLQPSIGLWHPTLYAFVEKLWFKLDTGDGDDLSTPLAMFKFDNTFDTKLAMFSVMMTCITRGYERNIYFYKPEFNVNLSIYKGFMKDRLSFQLYVNDLLGTNNNYTKCKYSKLKEMVFDEFSTSSISLTVRYKFNAVRSRYKGTGAGQSQKDRM